MSDERMPPLTDAEKVRLALEYGSEHTPALTREPVFVWTNAEAALDRLESQNQALQERVTRLRVARDALDEAATRPASAGEWEDAHNEFMDAVNNLLSPTQETDHVE